MFLAPNIKGDGPPSLWPISEITLTSYERDMGKFSGSWSTDIREYAPIKGEYRVGQNYDRYFSLVN